MNILLLEDDLVLSESIIELLEMQGYNIEHTDNGLDAEEFIINNEYDLLLLDINVKGGVSGFTLAKELREDGDKTPIIFITALIDLESMKKGYDLGIQDYIKKPFEPMELIFKLDSLTNKSKAQLIKYKHLEYDISLNEILVNKHTVKISNMEKIILDELITNRGITINKEHLKDIIGTNNDLSLRVFINKLKKKLDIDIVNIRGIGYKIEKE